MSIKYTLITVISATCNDNEDLGFVHFGNVHLGYVHFGYVHLGYVDFSSSVGLYSSLDFGVR